jgi:hypothetical protein
VPFAVAANDEVVLRAKSPNGADTDVDVSAFLYEVQMAGDSGATAIAREGSDGATHSLDTISTQIEQIGSGGGAAENEFVIAAPNGFVITTGVGEVNDEDATVVQDGTLHQIDDSGGTMDVYYLFDIGTGFSPRNIVHEGRANGANDPLNVYINTNTQASPTWVARALLPGQNITTNTRRTWPVASGDVMVGADAGKVAVRFHNTGLTSATLSTDQILMEKGSLASATGYELGAGWYDDNNGEAGVIIDYNGVARRPSNNVADMMTIAGLAKLRRFEVGGGSTWTFDRDMDNYTISGNSYTVDFAGFAGNGLTVTGATVTGELDGAGSGLVRCRLDDDVSLPPGGRLNCVHPGNVNLKGSFHLFDASRSALAGFVNTPSVTLVEAVTEQAVSWRDISGGMEVIGMKAGDTMTFEGNGQIIIDASCTAGEIAVRGNFTVSGDDTAIAAITWSEDARYDRLLVTGGSYALNTSAAGNIGVDWGKIENPGSTVDLADTTVNLVNTITTYTGNSLQTGNSFAIVNSGTFGNSALKTLIDAVKEDTSAILIDTGTAGVVVSAATQESMADTLLQRDLVNSDGSAAKYSVYTMVMSGLRWDIDGTDLRVRNTIGGLHTTIDLSTVGSADFVVGAS